ncbi:hypothetical protein BEL04_16685 [Mucilaginibacter sp. PPCGB 2223]|nr:hypothetical protein BEL04_16685 [Mucilaginibacter sp. PPCGB 2223]
MDIVKIFKLWVLGHFKFDIDLGVACGPRFPCPSGRRALIHLQALATRPVSLPAGRRAGAAIANAKNLHNLLT